MITVYPYEQLGHANHGWLDARHHFSFGRYYNPERSHFGVLRVINDDTIEAGRGFAAHPHDNMEIITYVREGAISHADNLGHEGSTVAGDVQVMSAGSGIVHAEKNAEPVTTKLYQIWIEPSKAQVTPRWEMRQFPKAPLNTHLSLLVSGQHEHEGQGAAFIHQDAAIYGGSLKAGTEIEQTVKHQAYILASEGEMIVNGATLHKGDGAEVSGHKTILIKAITDAQIIVIDVPSA
jgi:quercetin 2,3-dioxygenase